MSKTCDALTAVQRTHQQQNMQCINNVHLLYEKLHINGLHIQTI